MEVNFRQNDPMERTITKHRYDGNLHYDGKEMGKQVVHVRGSDEKKEAIHDGMKATMLRHFSIWLPYRLYNVLFETQIKLRMW